MATGFHVTGDIAGMLLNWSSMDFSYLTRADGTRFRDWREAKLELMRLFSAGVKFIRLGACDNFDPERGCLGHPVEDPTPEAPHPGSD